MDTFIKDTGADAWTLPRPRDLLPHLLQRLTAISPQIAARYAAAVLAVLRADDVATANVQRQSAREILDLASNEVHLRHAVDVDSRAGPPLHVLPAAPSLHAVHDAWVQWVACCRRLPTVTTRAGCRRARDQEPVGGEYKCNGAGAGSSGSDSLAESDESDDDGVSGAASAPLQPPPNQRWTNNHAATPSLLLLRAAVAHGAHGFTFDQPDAIPTPTVISGSSDTSAGWRSLPTAPEAVGGFAAAAAPPPEVERARAAWGACTHELLCVARAAVRCLALSMPR
jgi:hypothetical protein